MALLAGIKVHIKSEDTSNNTDVTSHPVEEGSNTTDHVQTNPQRISITGLVQGADAKKNCEDLESFMNKGKVISFEGSKAYLNMMITSFKYKVDKNLKSGYSFDASLQKVRMAEPSYKSLDTKMGSQVKGTSTAGRKQTQNAPSSDQEVFHTIRKGQTFYGIAPKYGTTWQKIIKLNPGVDPKKLQIGQKVRVK